MAAILPRHMEHARRLVHSLQAQPSSPGTPSHCVQNIGLKLVVKPVDEAGDGMYSRMAISSHSSAANCPYHGYHSPHLHSPLHPLRLQLYLHLYLAGGTARIDPRPSVR